MTTQLVPDRLALPPPFDFDLIDADRSVGWITGETVGFRGFADETEATHAAWIAHRTLAPVKPSVATTKRIRVESSRDSVPENGTITTAAIR